MNVDKKTMVLALYLPQYYENEDNNRWWGKGFTDWVNVRKAIPLFKGHYQPRQPYENYYYDLSENRALEWQLKIARKYGLGGFCFYHYWFNNKKRLLEKPLENYRVLKAKKIPYCICWANHTWSNTWGDKRIWDDTLIKQKYGDSNEWILHFDYLLNFFKDEEYICVDNKPVLVIYRAHDIPRGEKMIALWNAMAIENGFDGIYLIQMRTGLGYDKRTDLYSAVADFEPICTWANMCFDYKSNEAIERNLLLKDYDKIYCDIINRTWNDGFVHFYGAFPDWDNTPRKGRFGRVAVGSEPKKFEKYLKQILEKSSEFGKQFVFINAWNEWAEGAYLEPDKKNKFQYLEAFHRAIASIQEFEKAEEPVGSSDLGNSVYNSSNQILLNWLSAEVTGNTIKNFFVEAGLQSIAIYGAGVLGVILYHALRESCIEVKYMIDRKAGDIEIGIPLKLITRQDVDRQDEVDAIIVTISRDFYLIYDDLRKSGIKSEIISLEKIVNSL